MSETHVNEENEKELGPETNEETQEASQVEEIETENEVSEEMKELMEFKDKFYYVAAEMENLKRRHEKQLQDQIKFGTEKVMMGLLDVVDNLERTLQAISSDEDEKVKNIYTGVDMVKNQFLETLKTNGLEKIETEGKIFDPHFHEAMAQMPAEGKEDQEIVQTYQNGYSLNGRVIRAAKVVVAKN
ncbi:nucleotide exchange factor GrpE [Halobacteriovorax sp. XZX-3]|uniref:nucleotide exchange factor GrpE n=1 Tax=unclassified Halobacteriovorax TaxID=2639665 RepID=UPI000CD038DC|nr:nucleotide exchange factor GrpE [Halobacteriovorax sp. DA5]POB12429.1 nucleotide exchange factor GrpE [Halobacteriovorax sp. DA5]